MTPAEIAVIVSAFVALLAVGGIVYRAGAVLARIEAKVTGLESKVAPLEAIPTRLAIVEEQVKRHSEILDAAFEVVPHADRH